MQTSVFKKTRFHFNSDMSGDVIIQRTDTGHEIEILGDDLIQFVAIFFINECTSKLEQGDPVDLFKKHVLQRFVGLLLR